MKRRNLTIHDPDFGPIQLPAEPPLSPSEQNALRLRIRTRLNQHRVFQPGSTYGCHECGRRSVRAATDLTAEVVRNRTVRVFRNLEGGRCLECGAQYLEAKEELRIEDEAEAAIQPTLQARVARIGRGTLGTYWPRDFERRLRLAPGDRLYLEVLSDSSALIRVNRGPARSALGRSVRGRAATPRRARPKKRLR